MNISKILNILTIVMFAITLILLGLFYFGGKVPNQIYDTPVYTGELLGWCYILFFICAGAAVIFPTVQLFTRPKQAVKSLIGIVALVVVVLLSYSLADGTIMELTGYDGPDNVPSRLKLADMMLYTMYILGFAAIGAIVVTEIIRKIR